MPSLPYPLLSTIDSPADLRQLPTRQLPALAAELRDYLIESVARTGGHLGASLGTLELTVALHYVYDTPCDQLLWDVGHQSYPHKILTGRRERMHTMRKLDGLAGFPKRAESEYDTFGVGHSSTSISAALGMALAIRRARESGLQDESPEPRVVAVIGDGALTAGLAYEALNHAGDEKADMLVILNDNDMSISPNVGAMNKYLTRILSGKLVHGAREGGKKVLSRVPSMLELARKTEDHVKGLVTPSTLFEELGFNYYGPVDGHDLDSLVAVLENLRPMGGPTLLHVITEKGRGYRFAEADPLALHAVTPFDPATGKPLKSSASNKPTYTQVFGTWLCDMAEQDARLVGITPAMREGSGMVEFHKRFPQQYFDVGIAEQHSVTLAAGLACGAQKPVVAIYSSFLQRAYDQVVHDVAIQNLPVLFAIDRAGLVGADGPTHAGSFDYSFLRCLPNMTIMAPADENECRQMLYTGYCHDGPAAVRYPRGHGPGVEVDKAMTRLPIGQAEVRRQGHTVALMAFGSMVGVVAEIAEVLDCTLVNMRFVKPLDSRLVERMADSHRLLICLEENAVPGGAGAAVLEHLSETGRHTPVRLIGLPDEYTDQGSRDELLAAVRLDHQSLMQRIGAMIEALDPPVARVSPG